MSDGSGTGSGSDQPPDCGAGMVVNSAGECVQCIPGGNDCPAGEYCTAQSTCVAGCDGDNDCGPSASCCDHTCVDTTTLTDCGSCGNACAHGDFCDGTKCNAPTVPNFCANTTVYVIHDGIANDMTAADEMASTITANCPGTVTVSTANQTDATLVDQTTGQPLAGSGVTYVMGGGPYANKPVKWLESTQLVTKVYFYDDNVNFNWMVRGNATPVAGMVASACSTHKDQFVVELVTDPMSGTLSLVGYGSCVGGRGTRAAAYYYANVMLPNAASYPDSWYVFGWDDTNNDGAANAGDTYTLLAHGL
ncbi:MAG: hypothetical protein QM831_40360 [Kofleriaceae bacterium]